MGTMTATVWVVLMMFVRSASGYYGGPIMQEFTSYEKCEKARVWWLQQPVKIAAVACVEK
jgi:hypothetical protein